MNEGTKKRLAGTIVLVCLAVIFVPILLDGEGLRSPELKIDIPEAPALPRVSDIQPQRPDFVLEREAEQSARAELAQPIDSAQNTEVEQDTDVEQLSEPEQITEAAPESTIVPPVDTTIDDTATGPTPAPAPAVEAADTVADTQVEEADQETERPALNEQGLPDAWSVRLGTFGKQSNAETLVERLQAQDYKAYMRRSNNGTLTAVYVGPLLSREQADALRTELQSGYDLEGMVEKFTVEQ